MYSYYDLKQLKPDEIIMYLRKSRADDPFLTVEEVLSKHEAILDEFSEKNLTSPVPMENRYREIVSGGESIADRPEFQKVLKLIESPKIKAVMVVEISRLGRPDMEEIGKISKIFRYTNTLVITPMMTFNVANEYERDMFERELKRGQEYLEYTKKRLRAGRELSVKSGNCVLSRGIYGYDKIVIMEDKKRCPTLAINEEQANVVRMIFNWYVVENVGTSNIANRLNGMGLKSPRGNLWTGDSIRTIIENVHYIGMVTWNKRKGVLVVEDGEFRKTRPINTDDDVILVKGKHPPIISDELFNAAQEKRKRTHRTANNRQLRNPFASLLFCECGRAMSYRHSTFGNLKYHAEPRLVCNDQPHCNNGSCAVSEIVDFVAGALRRHIAEFELEAKKADDGKMKMREDLIRNLEKKIADLDAKELSLWEAQIGANSSSKMPQHIFDALTQKLTKEREDAKETIEKVRAEITAPIDYEKKIVTLERALNALLDDTVSVDEKNTLIKACIDKMIYQRDLATRNVGKGNGKGYTPAPIHLKINMRI